MTGEGTAIEIIEKKGLLYSNVISIARLFKTGCWKQQIRKQHINEKQKK